MRHIFFLFLFCPLTHQICCFLTGLSPSLNPAEASSFDHVRAKLFKHLKPNIQRTQARLQFDLFPQGTFLQETNFVDCLHKYEDFAQQPTDVVFERWTKNGYSYMQITLHSVEACSLFLNFQMVDSKNGHGIVKVDNSNNTLLVIPPIKLTSKFLTRSERAESAQISQQQLVVSLQSALVGDTGDKNQKYSLSLPCALFRLSLIFQILSLLLFSLLL